MPQYDLVALRSFVTVVETGSFNQAAELLESSTAAISRRVSSLEAALDVRLLNRTTRKIEITEAGKLFYHDVINIFHSLEEAEERIQQGTNTIKGTLRVAVGLSFGTICLSPLISSFMKIYPELEVQLLLDDHTTDLVAQRIDVAIRIGELKDSTLIATRVGNMPRIFCASPEYLQKHGEPTDPEQLTEHNCLRYNGGSTRHGFDFYRDNIQQNVDVSGSFSANNGEVLKDAAINGIGIILSPTFIVEDAINKGQLKAILCDFSPAPFGLYAMRLSRKYTPTKVSAFIDYLKDSCIAK